MKLTSDSPKLLTEMGKTLFLDTQYLCSGHQLHLENAVPQHTIAVTST